MIHYFTLLLLLTSCQSVSFPPNNIAQEQKKYFEQFKPIVEKSCFSKEEGNFFANISSPEAPSAFWEGRWNENFSHFKTQLLDPLGNVIESDSLSEIVAKFGPYGLREAMCGHTAFSPVLKLDGHKVVVKSTIKVNENQTILETTSKFYYGFFAKKNKNVLFWRGRIENNHVVPEFIRFGSDNTFLMVDFIDYE